MAQIPKDRSWVRPLMVALGAILGAVSINVFLVPQKLLPGGVSGIAVLVSYVTDLPAGPMWAAMNIPLFAIAWRQIAPSFAYLSLVGLVVFSAALWATAPWAGAIPLRESILGAIFGGVFLGSGGGLALRAHGSLAGTDIVGVLLRQRLGLSVASVVMALNVVIVAILGVVNGMETAFMTLVSMSASSWALDRVLTGLGRSKAVLVITDHPQPIVQGILHRLHRGATLLHGEGTYVPGPKRVIYCVLTQRQLVPLKRLVAELDPHAFVTVLDANEVVGEGFVRGPAG